MIKEAAPRNLVGFSNKKEPVSIKMMNEIVAKFGKIDASLADLRLVTMCLIAFAGFLRYQEVANLRCSDIVIRRSFMKMFVEQSKTDIHRTGAWVYVARTNNSTCPVSAMIRYMDLAKCSVLSDMFLFRGITRHKVVKSRRLRSKNTPLAYTTARSLMLNALTSLGYDCSLFGTHSLRAGGASAAASHRIEDRLFKKHGRWLSDRSKDRYVHEDLAQKLLVSQNLGL